MEEQMKTTVDIYDMKKKFIELDRDYYTFDGLEALLDYYDQVDENMEFDPIAICCDCTEYGDGKMVNAVLSFDDLVNDYGYLYPSEEWLEDNGAELDKDQTQEVIDLRHGGHGRAQAPAGRTLFNGYRRRDAAHGIHVGNGRRLNHGAGIGVERLQITALPFGKHNVKGERGLA